MYLSDDFIKNFFAPITDETYEYPPDPDDEQGKIEEQGKEANPYVYLPRGSEKLLAPENFGKKLIFPRNNLD